MLIKSLEKTPLVSWTITLAIAITIFYLSSKTFPQGTSTTSNLSIIYHFFAFFFLALFLLISTLKGKLNQQIFFISIIIAILYGASDELHQYFVPGRHFSLFDILTNSAGILTASVIYGLKCYGRM